MIKAFENNCRFNPAKHKQSQKTDIAKLRAELIKHQHGQDVQALDKGKYCSVRKCQGRLDRELYQNGEEKSKTPSDNTFL